jgi:lysophospholipid acyltransferase (LPLAT)-like uncharacterized protein
MLARHRPFYMKLRWDHPLWRRRAPDLARKLVQLYLRTCAVEVAVDPKVLEWVLAGHPVIYTTWHCHLLSPLYFARLYLAQLPALVLMASPSRDGEFIAEIARGLGFIVCSGSRRKGGVKALQQMTAYFRQGHSCGLVADGSRGPAQVAQKGVLYLARETQAPILPLAVASSLKLTFNSWDRFELPLPFSRVTLLLGEPLWVQPQDRGPALEARRAELETRLCRLFRESRSYFSS